MSWGEVMSAKGREEAEDAKGEGRPGALETGVEREGGNDGTGALPPMTSCIDGNDCLWESLSSIALLGSTGDMISGMLDTVE